MLRRIRVLTAGLQCWEKDAAAKYHCETYYDQSQKLEDEKWVDTIVFVCFKEALFQHVQLVNIIK